MFTSSKHELFYEFFHSHLSFKFLRDTVTWMMWLYIIFLKVDPFGFSKLRLQPKENGVRMVANLEGSSRMPLLMSTMGVRNWKTKGKVKNHSKYKHYPSVNSVLRDAHTILKGIRFKEPNKLGSSVFDTMDCIIPILEFLMK